jgi:hypothetical protein
MALRAAKLVAFDGTHASGKTTLIYAVAGLLRGQGVQVTTLDEPARSSPFVDDVVIHRAGDFDMLLELDILQRTSPIACEQLAITTSYSPIRRRPTCSRTARCS